MIWLNGTVGVIPGGNDCAPIPWPPGAKPCGNCPGFWMKPGNGCPPIPAPPGLTVCCGTCNTCADALTHNRYQQAALIIGQKHFLIVLTSADSASILSIPSKH